MKTIGIIGPGAHFRKSIFPVLTKSNFFRIDGILRRKKKSIKNIKSFDEKKFFKKRFDFIYISCPNKFHENYIIKSLKNGSHVICEKPFVTRDKKISEIIELAKKKKKLIFEAFMYLYHPVFKYVESLIREKKYGKLRYLISNFRYPSLKKNNNRYKKNEGGGFFYDAASYVISLENLIFKGKNKTKIHLQKIKSGVDLRGNIFLKSKEGNRFYFWGEGQNYFNNVEIFFDNATIYIDKFFSKKKNEVIKANINALRKKIITFNKIDQFERMFYSVQENYNKKSFQKCHIDRIKNQLYLLLKFNI